MPLWTMSNAGRQEAGGRLTATSLLTGVTANATPHVKGGYVGMIPSTAFETSALHVHLGQTGVATSASNTQALLDVGVGGSGAEQTVVSNIAIGGNLPFASWLIPLVIPAGSRIALRIQSLVANKSVTMGVITVGGGYGLEGGYQATTYGALSSSNSRGTILTAPAAANSVEGAWTLLDAAMANMCRWIVVGLAAPNFASTTAATGFIDIGVGASGQEQPVVSDIAYSVSLGEDISFHTPLTFPAYIQAGSRLSARYRSSSTATTSSPSVTVTGIA